MRKPFVFLLLALLLPLLLLRERPAQAGTEEETLLCRFGVNYASGLPGDDPTNYDLTLLRSGWYIDYRAQLDPWGPAGATYGRVVALHDNRSTDTYSYSPNAATIEAVAQANPGSRWFIGNEPDRVDVQDDVRPHVYAHAYHELYHLIKDADPAARIFAGTIVQATPIRLAYLDLMLAGYEEAFGQRMPVDGWSIHGFILNEVDCDWNDEMCWGADVPPGVPVDHGEILDIQDNDDVGLFIERIERFRRWMAANGYRDKPLSLSEYGILMPVEYGFSAARVNTFMDTTFAYMQQATDPVTGYPRDGNRLVQDWSWFSVADAEAFNGWLFDPDTKQLSAMGYNYAAYTGNVEERIDLYPVRVETVPAPLFSPTETVTATVQAVIANSGNLAAATEPVAVRFYNGNPAQGATQIGATQTVSLAGCGDYAVVGVTWASLSPGTNPVYVTVAAATGEENGGNNTLGTQVSVNRERSLLPLVSHRR